MTLSSPDRNRHRYLETALEAANEARGVAQFAIDDIRLSFTGDIDASDLAHTLSFVARGKSASVPSAHERQFHIARSDTFGLAVERVRETCALRGQRFAHMSRALDVYRDDGADLDVAVESGHHGSLSLGRADTRLLVIERGSAALPRLVHWLVVDLLRGIREQQGAVSFHAAALAYKHAGVLLLGPSGSGKTTTLLHLLSIEGAALLCNDRINIDPRSHLMHPTPLPVRLGWGCAANWPALAVWLEDQEDGPRRTLRDEIAGFRRSGANAIQAEFGASRKVTLTPSEVSELTGAPLAERAPLELIIVPKLRLDPTPARIRPLPKTEVVSLLCSECRTPIDNVWPEHWLEARTVGAMGASRRSPVEALRGIATVPAFEIEFDVGCGPAEVAALVERCFEMG